jgi:hypothetical protein
MRRCCLLATEFAARRRTVAVSSHLTMSNSPRRLVPARGRARVSFTCTHRIEGWAERREAHLVVVVAPFGASVAARVRRGAYVALGPRNARSPFGAPPWRCSAGALSSPELRRASPRKSRRRRAARSVSGIVAGFGRGPDLPRRAVLSAAAGRHSLLRLQVRLRRRPLDERGCESCSIDTYSSQVQNVVNEQVKLRDPRFAWGVCARRTAGPVSRVAMTT